MTLPPALWLVYLGNLLWTVSYDTAYAMVDREDDLKIGVKSTAILFGRHDLLIIGLLQVVMLLLLIYAGVLSGRGSFTGTVTAEVWSRPWVSVLGTRCTR